MENNATFIQQLPKTELHVHLEGAISPQTVLDLARKNNMLNTLPSNTVEGLKDWFVFSDFPNFVEKYVTIQELLRTPEDFELIAYRLGEDMAAQNILYREATFTITTHTDYLDKGLEAIDILGGLEKGRQHAKKDFGVEIRWVFDIARNYCFKNEDPTQYMPSLSEKNVAYSILGMDYGVVGFGLGGYEVNAPPEPFAHAFQVAIKAGLLSVPHAGETEGPASVWGAINDLSAHRIGHGVRAIEDASLVQALVERKIPLEINPTSNIILHVYPDFASHPLRKLDEAGVIITINSDDPPLFNCSLNGEYQLLIDQFDYKKEGVLRFARNSFIHAGVEKETKAILLSKFDNFVATL
jgi:aminodeoxyfutalosine deaminase